MYEIKKRLLNGELVLGTIVSEVRNPNIAYMLAQSGFEFFIIDNEHGCYSSETISDMIAGARGAGIAVIVRVCEITRESILKPLDSGASGLLVPQVNTAEQAREIVLHAKYPPAGARGVGLRRPHSLYGRVNCAEYLKQANENTFIAVQAETPEAIANVESIASIDGIDCVFAGPFDLSVSLGIPGQLSHPREIEAIDTMLEACRKYNKIGGILMFDTLALRSWIEKGMRFVAYSSDITLLADAAQKAVEELKACAKYENKK